MYQPYMIIDGVRYEQGTIFVVKKFDGACYVEYRTTFAYYDTEHNRYQFLTPNKAGADSATSYHDTRFMGNLIRIEEPTLKERKILQGYLERVELRMRKSKYSINEDNVSLLLIIGLVVLLVVLPPVGLVVLLCMVFSNKTLSGFLGCLTPFLILVGIALLAMLFK